MANGVDYSTKGGLIDAQEAANFVMTHVDAAKEKRADLETQWEENLQNYFVLPNVAIGPRSTGGLTSDPLNRKSAGGFSYAFGDSILIDPESHQIVETYLAKLWLAIFGEEEYIQARGRGVEDAWKGDTASRLLSYFLSKAGHTRTTYEWLKDALIIGTGVVELTWSYRTEIMRQMGIDVDPFTGEESQVEFEAEQVVEDDPGIRVVDAMDFYSDPGEHRMEHMRGVAKGFETTRHQAELNAERDIWNKAATKRAIQNHGRSKRDPTGLDYLKDVDDRETLSEFGSMYGYEYWGEVPWDVKEGQSKWRVLTVVNGELVRNRNWPLLTHRVPFYDITIKPVSGRFYGVSPLAVNRFDQDFLNVLKSNIADAVIRGTHPPYMYERSARPDKNALRRFNPRVPVAVDRIDGIKQAEYRPPIGDAVGVYNMVKSHEREGSGALGVTQGLGLGSKRFSATEAVQTFEQAMDPMEMLAVLIERESLPPLAHGVLGMYRKFMTDPDDLTDRIGERPGSVPLSAIHGKFDIKFVGSRRQHDRQSKAQAMERFLAVVGNIPPIAAMVPWEDWLPEYTDTLDLPKIRAKIADPQVILRNVVLQQALGANRQNNNGETQRTPPSGLMPAQTAGRGLNG